MIIAAVAKSLKFSLTYQQFKKVLFKLASCIDSSLSILKYIFLHPSFLEEDDPSMNFGDQ